MTGFGRQREYDSQPTICNIQILADIEVARDRHRFRLAFDSGQELSRSARTAPEIIDSLLSIDKPNYQLLE